MKRLLTFFICILLTLSTWSVAASALEAELAGLSAEEELSESGATADEMAPVAYNLLTEAEFQNKLAYLRDKYPDGSIWEGVYYEGGSAKAWTCFAYAAQMMYEVFGARFYGDRLFDLYDYNFSGIRAGDIVRIDYDSHSIFITEVTANGFYFTDGNGTGVYNQVRWDGFYSYSELQSRFTYKVQLPGNTLSGGRIFHSIAYSANGGSGSMSSDGVSPGGSFQLQDNEFSRSGYSFAGYTCKRSYDNTWYTTDAGWQTQDEIYNNGYHYKIYPEGRTYTLGTPWIGDITTSTTFTFYAQWLPDQSTLEFADNYSGYNYILGSDLKIGYDRYIYPRDAVYSVEVDGGERLNNADSLKITGSRAGSMGSDLAIITSTNRGYGNGYSQAGLVGDDKTFTLHFYAKANVDGAKMYFRWGFTTNFVSVSLSKEWKTYSLELPKNRFCGYALHPYFDKPGTFYLNSLSLGDVSWTSNVVPESGGVSVSTVKVERGEAPDYLPTPAREGYVFKGWYTAAEGGSRISTQTPINETTLRLYAHWRKDISYTPVKTVTWNGNLYELYDNSLKWDEAEQFCEAKGGHLVTVGSAEENAVAYDMISDRQGYCWIGLSSEPDTTDWQWVDGSPFRYNKWYDSSYGTKDSGEYYAMLYPMNFGTRNYASTWDKCTGSNYYCSFYGYYNSCFICEYDDPSFSGDVDGDGEVSIMDASLLKRSLAGLKTDLSESDLNRGDVDGNGELEVIDATYIQRFTAQIETPFAIGERLKNS